MSVGVRGNLKMAIAGLKGAKWRSLLTMLGVIIGVVSVVTVVGIGEGVKRQVSQQVNHFGKDLLIVRPGHVGQNKGAKTLGNTDLLFGLNTLSGMTPADLTTVQTAPHVKAAAPLGVVPGTLSVDDKNIASPLVIATSPELADTLNQSIAYGDFFGDNNDGNGAVIGRHIAEDLFGANVPLGESFTFRGRTFVVRGMFSEFDASPLSPTANFNDAIFIPYKTAENLTGSSTQFYTILVKPDDPKDTRSTTDAVNAALMKAHGGEQDFSVMDRQQSLESSGNILGLLTSWIAGVAAISLLVGGIGIMNIMLVSVTERMHEIGVRKAIGATNRQILSQFMLEAIVLSVTGGVIGIVISLLVDLLLHAYTSLRPVISWQSIVIATAVSIVIGIVFGTAPAVKAARKDPIQALRHE